jgi:hypothetical protein
VRAVREAGSEICFQISVAVTGTVDVEMFRAVNEDMVEGLPENFMSHPSVSETRSEE